MAGKDRKKQLARQRYERQEQRRRAQEARARRLRIIGSVVAVAVVAGGAAGIVALVGNDDDSNAETQPSATPQAQATTPKPGECAYPASEGKASKDVGKPPVKPAYDKAVEATLKTSEGDVKLELDGKKAPCTVNSFAHLAEKKYFDKTDCHRLTSGGLNVLQCGDPTGSGSGGPGYQFANENTEGAQYVKGTVAMANAGPDTNGSQFFLVYGDSKQLPPDYSVFGKITSGMDVLEKIAKAGSEPQGDGKPKTKVTIQDVTIAGN